MTRFKTKNFNSSFKNASKGMRLVLKSERNIRMHMVIAVCVIFLAILFGFKPVEMCVLFLTIGLVIITEMLNTAIEFALDAIFRNKYCTLVGMAKDISAGAVMVASIISVAVGLILFGQAMFRAFFS